MESSSGRKYLVDIVVVLVLVSLGYLGYKFVPAYIDHYRLRNAVNDVMVEVTRTTSAQSVKASLREVAQTYGIELLPDDIQIQNQNQVMSVQFSYRRAVAIPLTDKDILLSFTVEDEKDYRMW